MKNSVKFYFPQPENPTQNRIWPVFLPHQGCPNRCIYCAQVLQTNTKIRSLEEYYRDLRNQLESALSNRHYPLELAFYGSTFTGLPGKWPYRFLELVQEFKEKGFVTRVRCSTRPDFLSPDLLRDFKKFGLDLVEIGIQSFSREVLQVSQRGYSSDVAQESCYFVKQSGMQLGIQLLPGLPRYTSKTWFQDLNKTINQAPSLVRIYPCLTIRGTKLAKLWEQSRYSPWSIQETCSLLARGVLRLWKNNIKVHRIGLPQEKEMINNLRAGPWHPALGAIIQSRILYYLIRTYKLFLDNSRVWLYCPKRYQGLIWGHKGMNKPGLEKIGITPENVTFWEKDYFLLGSSPVRAG